MHCYNNLPLLDTSPSMTFTQNRCHTHLVQAVLQRYIFIPHCHDDFQSPFPFAALRAGQHKEEEPAVACLPATAFLDLTSFLSP